MVRKGGRFPLAVRLRLASYWLPPYAIDANNEFLEAFKEWWMPKPLTYGTGRPMHSPASPGGAALESELESDTRGEYVLIYHGGRYVALGERRSKQARWHIDRPARLKEMNARSGFRTAETLLARVRATITAPGFIDYCRPMTQPSGASYLHQAARTWLCDGDQHGRRAPECARKIYEGELYFARTGRWGQHTCQPCAFALYARLVRQAPSEPEPTLEEQMRARANRWWSRNGIHVHWLRGQERHSHCDSYPASLVSSELAVRIGAEYAVERSPTCDVFRLRGDTPNPWRVRGHTGAFRTATEAMNMLAQVREFQPPAGFRLTNEGTSRFFLALDQSTLPARTSG